MKEQKVQIINAFKYGLEKLKTDTWYIYSILIILLIVTILPQILIRLHLGTSSIFLYIIFTILSLIVTMGKIKIFLGLVDGKRLPYKTLFTQIPIFFTYVLLSLLCALIMLAGFLLLIVPGIIWYIKYCWAFLIVVDKRIGALEALKLSAKITYGHKWDLFVFWLASVGFNVLGFLCLGIGTIITFPVTIIAYYWMYKRLLD